MQVGNSSNYQEAALNLDFTGWRLFVLEQADVTGDNIADLWRDKSGYGVTISSVGTANFQQVSMLTAGVRVTDPLNMSGYVWLDEVHLGQPKVLIGQARKVQLDMEIPGIATFGGKYRYVDRNFQTPVTSVTNQDNEQDTAYLNITAFREFPMSFDYARQITVTPNTLNTGNNNLIGLLQQGTVKRNSGNARGQVLLDGLPKLSLAYSFATVKYELLTRKDDQRTYSTSLSHTMPRTPFYLPKSIEASYAYTRTKLDYESMEVLKTSGYYNSDEQLDAYSLALGFKPWNGSSLNPNYSEQSSRESRTDYTGAAVQRTSYDKYRSQTTGFNSNFMFLPWLNPSFSYSSTIIENNNLTISTVTVGSRSQVYDVGQIKDCQQDRFRQYKPYFERRAGGEELAPAPYDGDFLHLSAADGDLWQNVENALDTHAALWVRTPLRPSAVLASRTNLTLRDTINSTQRWQPFDAYALTGRLSPLRTMAISNNYITSIQRSEVTGTQSRTITRTLPDAVLSISQLENMLAIERWASGVTAYLKYAAHTTENVGLTLAKDNGYGMDLRFMLWNALDTSFSGNYKKTVTTDLRLGKVTETNEHKDLGLQAGFNVKKFRFTPRVDYTNDFVQEGGGAITQNTTQLTPSVLVRADLYLPKGLRLPFMDKTLEFTNRIIWTTTTKYIMKRSPVDTTLNSNTFSCNSTADYELSKNLRLALNASLERLWHLNLPQDDYISYQAGTTLTLQF